MCITAINRAISSAAARRKFLLANRIRKLTNDRSAVFGQLKTLAADGERIFPVLLGPGQPAQALPFLRTSKQKPLNWGNAAELLGIDIRRVNRAKSRAGRDLGLDFKDFVRPSQGNRTQWQREAQQARQERQVQQAQPAGPDVAHEAGPSKRQRVWM